MEKVIAERSNVSLLFIFQIIGLANRELDDKQIPLAKCYKTIS